MKLILISLCALTLVGCGGSDDNSDTQASKDLFSYWSEVGGTESFDLAGGDFSQELPFSIYFENGAECNCDIRFFGTQDSGSYALNSCTYQIGSGAQDLGCESLNQTGVFTKTIDTLTLSNSNGDFFYR